MKKPVKDKVSLSKIELRNYRSCKNTVVELTPQLTTLIGANGAGKSNILQGILLLQKLARAAPYRSRGGPVTTICDVRATFDVGPERLRYRATIGSSTDDRNQDEIVDAKERWLVIDKSKKRRSVELRMSAIIERQRGVRIVFPETQRTLFEPAWLESADKTDRKTLSLVSRVYDFVLGMTYYSASRFTDPTKCPASFEIEEEERRFRISPPGSHLQVMRDLYRAWKSSRKNFELFLSVVGKEGIGLIDTIEFREVAVSSSDVKVRTGGKIVKRSEKNILVIPHFIIQKSRLSPNQLSEGTFKTLALVFYLLTDRSSLILVEEPEVCVHHGLLSSIVELIKQSAAQKQIIMSTHSDFVLDSIDPNDVCLVRNLPTKGTRADRIPRALGARGLVALRDYLSTEGNLGEYWRLGRLGK